MLIPPWLKGGSLISSQLLIKAKWKIIKKPVMSVKKQLRRQKTMLVIKNKDDQRPVEV